MAQIKNLGLIVFYLNWKKWVWRVSKGWILEKAYMGQVSTDFFLEEKKNHNIPIPMVHENICIDLMNYMDPSKNWGSPFCGLKITKTEHAKIVSGLEKTHNIY